MAATPAGSIPKQMMFLQADSETISSKQAPNRMKAQNARGVQSFPQTQNLVIKHQA
jgi:hypothetical protein